MSENYQSLATTFYQYQLRLGYRQIGSKANYYQLKEFLNWLEYQGQNQIAKITPKHITDYYDYLSRRPSKKGNSVLSQKTTHGHMRVIRDFFVMLETIAIPQITSQKTNPCSLLKFPYPKQTPQRNILDQSEIKALYASTATFQERAILSLAYGCGLRASELAGCNIADIRLREKLLIVPKGKGNKRRVIPMSKGVAKDLSDYYHQERGQCLPCRQTGLPAGNKTITAFMLHSKGDRMQRYTYNKILKAIIERAVKQEQLPTEILQRKITIHSLRHSIATHLLAQGIAVEQVRLFLGHSQLETTQLYTHISQAQLKGLMKE